MRTGTANLPLHRGAAPAWLFARMARLAREIVILMVDEYETQGYMRRLSDPRGFRTFGRVLGFDWHSSELTTTICGALNEGRASSLQSPLTTLVYPSRMFARVDNTAIQDGYPLYYHKTVQVTGLSFHRARMMAT